MMRRCLAVISGCLLGVLAASAAAQEDRPKVLIAIDDRLGLAPLRLAEEEGLFANQGVQVELVVLPPREQHLALSEGSVQAVAGPVHAQVAYAAAGVPLAVVLLVSRSTGADALVVRPEIGSVEDLRGKTVAVDGPGTAPFFLLNAILKDHGVELEDLLLTTLEPEEAAFAFATGQFDAIVTSEPYLSHLRDDPEDGRILISSNDHPLIVETLAVDRALARDQPAVVDAIVRGYFAALGIIAEDPAGASARAASAGVRVGGTLDTAADHLEWPDAGAQQRFFENELAALLSEIAEIQKQVGVIEEVPDIETMVEPSFVKAMR